MMRRRLDHIALQGIVDRNSRVITRRQANCHLEEQLDCEGCTGSSTMHRHKLQKGVLGIPAQLSIALPYT